MWKLIFKLYLVLSCIHWFFCREKINNSLQLLCLRDNLTLDRKITLLKLLFRNNNPLFPCTNIKTEIFSYVSYLNAVNGLMSMWFHNFMENKLQKMHWADNSWNQLFESICIHNLRSLLLRQRFPPHFILEKAIYQKTKTWLHEYFYFRNTFTLTGFPFKEKQSKKCNCLKTLQLKTFINNYRKKYDSVNKSSLLFHDVQTLDKKIIVRMSKLSENSYTTNGFT